LDLKESIQFDSFKRGWSMLSDLFAHCNLKQWLCSYKLHPV
jgi:hypothetical protein